MMNPIVIGRAKEAHWRTPSSEVRYFREAEPLVTRPGCKTPYERHLPQYQPEQCID